MFKNLRQGKKASQVLILLMLGCTEVNPIAETNVLYKRDVRIGFEGQEFFGVAVLPPRERYELELTFAGELDLFTFRSCHREVTQEDAGGGKIFGKKNKVSYTYVPVSPIETAKQCTVEIEGHEAEKGRHSWAFLEFETPLETLPGLTICNGVRKQWKGVSVCQSLAGLIQNVVFTRPVRAFHSDDCPGVYTKDNLSFEVMQGKGRCSYSFRTMGEEPRDWHRYTSFGYSEILVRSL
jgi:hypothetical protein